MRTFTLVSCVGKKFYRAANAEHLYRSPWFRLASAYARRNSSGWAILSAKHGLVYPWEVIEPYEMTLNTMSKNDRKTWSNKVIYELAMQEWDCYEILAGKKYREFICPWMADNGIEYYVPMEGLGIGQQLKWLKEHL